MDSLKTNIIILVVILGIIGFIAYDTFSNGPTNKEANTVTDTKIREIAIVAKQFSFSPDPIKVKLNEKVRFRIKSADVAHGLSIPDFGFNANIAPGQETVAEFLARKKGKFMVRCSVFCGGGHPSMTGKLIVE